MQMLSNISIAIGAIGVIVITWGAVISMADFCILEVRRLKGKNPYAERNHIRRYLSSYLLIGLEYMIAADLIRTLINPTIQELIVLGAMVAIRTVTSYFLNREMELYHK